MNNLSTRVYLFFSHLCEQFPANFAPFELQLPGQPAQRFGSGDATFKITVHGDDGLSAILTGDETSIAESYMDGGIDLEGDMLALYSFRNGLTDRHPIAYLWWVRLQPFLFGQVNRDRKWIAEHYDYDQDFYLLFLDRRTRAYSQGVFICEDEPLEAAQERKLEFALHSCHVEPGQRVLDIGGGWGTFVEYAGQRGVQVTSLTISTESEEFIRRLIAEQGLPCRVLCEHFYEHTNLEGYDAIVNLGVTEHLPDYRRTLAHYQRLLKPGGRVYLDASACREKWAFSSFIYRHIYPGNPTPMCLAEYLAEVERSPFELMELHNDRRSYELTSRRWAENLDAAREVIVSRWGEVLYRKFRLYFWGTTHAFATGLLNAYRLVLQSPATHSDLRRWRR